jgi:hypothetical protein
VTGGRCTVTWVNAGHLQQSVDATTLTGLDEFRTPGDDDWFGFPKLSLGPERLSRIVLFPVEYS